MTESETKQYVSESLLLHRVLNLKREVEALRNDFLAEQCIIAPVARIQNDLQDLIMLLPSVRKAEAELTN